MATKPRVYVDSCYYIDVAKGRMSQTLDPGRDKHIPYIEGLLLAAHSGDVEVWASTLIISECLAVEKDQQDVPDEVQKMFIQLLTAGSAVKMASVDFFVAERARDLRWVDSIKCGGGADMTHIATALLLNCEEFITTNRKRGPLQGDASEKLVKLGMRIIEAPSTSVLPPQFVPPPLFVAPDE